MRQYRVAPKLSALVVLAQFTFFLASWWLIGHHTTQTVATILETQSEDAMNRILDTVPAAIVNDDSISIQVVFCLLYTSPSPRDKRQYRIPACG